MLAKGKSARETMIGILTDTVSEERKRNQMRKRGVTEGPRVDPRHDDAVAVVIDGSGDRETVLVQSLRREPTVKQF